MFSQLLNSPASESPPPRWAVAVAMLLIAAATATLAVALPPTPAADHAPIVGGAQAPSAPARS